MRQTIWNALVSVATITVPGVAPGQNPTPALPRATIRELATIQGAVNGFVLLPQRNVLIYSIADSTFTYDVATKRRAVLGTSMLPESVSPQGDRLAFRRVAEDGTGDRIWTMPIDPRTGSATGRGQLLSQRAVDRSSRPRFSPDGQTIAFDVRVQPDSWSVVVVPTSGGVERVVASYPGATRFSWSPDGASIDVEVYAGQTAIERVAISSGAKRPLFPKTQASATMVVGVSPDARVAVHTMNPDRFFYATPAGTEGEIDVPLPALDDGWGFDFTMDSNRYLSLTRLEGRQVRILDLATGRTRTLLPNEPTSAPAWSPDGRRVAVLAGTLSHYDVVIMNADGSGQRRYPISQQLLNTPGSWDMPWSPDGKYFAFAAELRARVGYTPENRRQIMILDVASGATRVLGSTAQYADANFAGFDWRSDANAIRVVKFVTSPTGQRLRTIVELSLDGKETLLRDVTAEFPTAFNLVLSSDREAVTIMRAADGPQWYVLPLPGGAPRRLPDPRVPVGTRNEWIRVGKSLLFARVDASGAQLIQILSTAGDSTRTLRLPGSGGNAAAFPGGAAFIQTSRTRGDSMAKLFVVSIDGSAPRQIGQIPSTAVERVAPSPDGKLVAYTSTGRITSRIHEIDFGPVIQAVLRR